MCDDFNVSLTERRTDFIRDGVTWAVIDQKDVSVQDHKIVNNDQRDKISKGKQRQEWVIQTHRTPEDTRFQKVSKSTSGVMIESHSIFLSLSLSVSVLFRSVACIQFAECGNIQWCRDVKLQAWLFLIFCCVSFLLIAGWLGSWVGRRAG